MYKTILVTLDRTPTDRAIIEHIKPLAKLLGSRILLLHVATGVPARYHRSEAAGKEVVEATAYLDKIQAEFVQDGISVEAELGYGDAVKEIVNLVRKKGCDLVAMSTHGHQFVGDLLFGTTAVNVQHSISVPVLMLRAK